MQADYAIDTIALIDQLIEEHKVITRTGANLGQIFNDVEARIGLEKAKDIFVPGRLDQKKALNDFEALLETYAVGLDAHFNREETALLKAFEQYGEQDLLKVLNALLAEHAELRIRVVEMKKHVDELLRGELAAHFWSARAHDMRVYLNHTLKVIGIHAANEFELFTRLKKQLQQAKGAKS